MRNTAEYEAYLTNPLEDRYPEEPTPTCDECGEPQGEQEWCGECGCCRSCCKNEYVDCEPAGLKQYNVTLIHDLFTITTLVTAEDREEAVNVAEQFFTQDQGLPDWVATKAGDTQVELQALLA